MTRKKKEEAVDDRSRLREIERELDRTDPREGGPYRNKRRKLNRERERIIRRLEGMDPMYFATGEVGRPAPRSNQRNAYALKKEVVSILEALGGKR